jgi:hypothetical protein
MAVTPKFNAADVRKQLLARKQRLEEATLLRLQRVGETFITNARSNNTYQDQTGNLRSSIGYVILKDGVQVVGSAFEVVKKGNKGSQIGEEMVGAIAKSYPTGFVLIVVAGMDYAAAVEAKGFDVLTVSGLQAASDLKKALEKLKV